MFSYNLLVIICLSHLVALESTQPLTEVSTRNPSWGRADNLTPSCAECLEILDPQLPGSPKSCPGLQRETFTFIQRTDMFRLFPSHLQGACYMVQRKNNVFIIQDSKCFSVPIYHVLHSKCGSSDVYREASLFGSLKRIFFRRPK